MAWFTALCKGLSNNCGSELDGVSGWHPLDRVLECQAIMIKFNYCMFPQDPAAIDCSDDMVNAGRNLSATQRASFLPTSTFEKPVP